MAVASFVAFDLSPLTGKTIVSATLNLETRTGPVGYYPQNFRIGAADDGFIYVQEDEAEEDTLSSDEVLFGEGAVNPKEAGIVRLNPRNGHTRRVATIDRSVVIDASIDENDAEISFSRPQA